MNVSVVIPAFNAAATIARTLDSLLAQTVKDWEAVVVDDGSRDGTGRIAKSFAARDCRIRLLRQPNQGESAARNTGLAAVRYDWLLFLDPDDWIHPEYLQRMIAVLAADPELDAVHCGYARVARDGTLVIDKYLPPTGDMFPVWARRSAFPVHACLVRKTLVDEVRGFDRSLENSADWDFWQRIARSGARFGAVRDVLAYYRMRPTAKSLQARHLLRAGLRVLRQGHAPDRRVLHPHPDHALGEPPDGIRTQAFYLLSWCAGLALGAGQDARPLLRLLGTLEFAELYPEAVAQCLFEAIPLPTCAPPAAWEELWPVHRGQIQEFLVALENKAGAPGLAPRARTALIRMILRTAPSWASVFQELELARTEEEEQHRHWERVAREQDRNRQELADRLAQLEARLDELEGRRRHWECLAREREEALEERRLHLVEFGETQAELEAQRLRWKQEAQQRELELQHLQASLAELAQARTALEQQRSHWERLARERERNLQEHGAQLERLEATVREQRERHGLIEEASRRWETLAVNRREALEDLTSRHATLEGERMALEAQAKKFRQDRIELRQRLQRSHQDRDLLFDSPERRLGDLILNRLRFGKPLRVARGVATVLGQRLILARLALERMLSGRQSRRAMTTVCWNFPIHSQTFVYQELCSLADRGFSLRLVYSKLESPDQLPAPFARLWKAKRRLFLNRRIHQRNLAHYLARMPEKVERLIGRLVTASGLSRAELIEHGNFLEAFTFTRMAEAYRPAYLHSYFFYDRSLLALVAGYLLDIPRGISCYTDHMLEDYELKVVPLHLELCDIVVATSERIKRELIALAPQVDPGRILVKSNGIDTDTFALRERSEPENGAPFRVVSVSRIEPKKGLLDLVEAVHLLRQRGRRVEAHLIGAPDQWSAESREYKQLVEKRITDLNLWGTVHLEGRLGLPGVQRLLGLAHLFAAPYVETETGDKDGIPTALLEAMATGLPAVATDAGSIPEVIEHGADGLLTQQRNPAALADAIETLLLDRERRDRLGRAAAAKVRRHFDAESCGAVLDQRVREVLRARGDAG